MQYLYKLQDKIAKLLKKF